MNTIVRMNQTTHINTIDCHLWRISNMEIYWLYTLLSFFFFIFLAFNLSTKSKRKLPPSPVLAFPLLGHIHLLKAPIYRTFHKLSQKLGPIFSLRLGARRVVVVSSHALAEECFTKNDIVLANRPRFIAGKYIGYNYTSLVLSPYGDHWRNLRRLTTIEVFSTTRLNTFVAIREDEIRRQLEKIYKMSKHGFVQVELKRVFMDLTFNNIMRMVAGKRYFGEGENSEEAKMFQKNMAELFKAASITNPVEFVPPLRWLGYEGYEKNLERISKNMDSFLQSLIDERKGDNNNKSTMIDHLLSLQESEPEYYSDAIIKGIIMVMLLAGTETVTVTMEWAMSSLLNHPEKLAKARDEIDKTIGNTCLINESDMPKLPYLQNIISETYRLFPAAPLLLFHEASADCKIAGYDMPQGTLLLVNAWAIHRDPTIWDDPSSFKPERFEVGEIATNKLIQFGMGRRSCPGNGLAQRVLGLTLGSLIQCFEWERVSEEMLDMTEELRVTLMPKAIPLEARCKARKVLDKALSQHV